MSNFIVKTPWGSTEVEADICRSLPYHTGMVVLERVTKKGWLFDRVETVATFYGVVSVVRAD